jgi:uncharacterized repeat protein (TIGR03803 family)
MSSSLAVLTVLAMLVGQAGAANTTEVIFSFAEEAGEYPSTELVMDGAGNIYGTAVQGGQFGGGTVFQLAPSGDGWTYTVLHDFTGGADGGQPYGGVTLDPQGNLFGTAVIGGSGGVCVEDGCGVAYMLTKDGGTWTHSVIHDFTGGNDGFGPGVGLTRDARGNLYGMTPTGGAYGLGTIFQLKRNHNGTWTQRVIHTFTGGLDGATGSAGRLLLDDAGNLSGVATVGGAHGAGTAFRLRRAPRGRWRLKTLYAFKGQPFAGNPYGALLFDEAGSLYGTTYYDGEYDLGTVYKLTREDGSWTETVLYSFRGGMDGASPISNLVFDESGTIYGTTSEGGAPGCGCGTIFRLTEANGEWTESVVHAFEGTPDGAYPYAGMLVGMSGTFFGATVHGGDDDDGSIYEFTP